MSTLPISVVVNTKNSASTLKRALNSVKKAEEIVIADMQSQDRTKDIAAQFTDTIIDVDDVGYVEPARNKAIAQATQDWILILDADEEISKTLLEKIQECIEKAQHDIVAFEIPRQNIIFAHPMEATGWWPDYQLRLFRKGSVTWNDTIHSVPVVKGEIKKLPALPELAITHHNYQAVTQFIQRLDRYTTITADTEDGTTAAPHPLTTFFSQFSSRFFAQQGFKDGTHGSALSLLQAMYEVTTELKEWEHSNFIEAKKVDPDELKIIHKDLNYWFSDYFANHSSGLEKIYWKIRRKLKL